MIAIREKFKEIIWAVLPIVGIVLLIHFFVIHLETITLVKFLLGAVFMVIGIPIFLYGIDLSITPIGDHLSEALVKTDHVSWILIGGIFLGFIASAAEIDLHILGRQVSAITGGRFNSNLLVLMVSVLIGLMVALSLLRILKNYRLNRVLAVLYGIILILGIFTRPEVLAIAFDASGSTTGSISVPFLLAISVGVSSLTRSREVETNDAFGILGIASAGAIIAVMLQGLFYKGDLLVGSLPVATPIEQSVFLDFLKAIPSQALNTAIILLPILLTFFAANFLSLKLKSLQLKRILIGTLYTYIGVVIFQTGVDAGFIAASQKIGFQIAAMEKPWLLILVGVVLGVSTVPAEPSIHILTRRIEDETAGAIRANVVMIAMCLGIALSVVFSMLRILIPSVQLWHFLLPGTVIAIALSFVVPDLFVGIAFDSGGVASGTMIAVLLLPFANGAAAYIPTANIMQDGFGIIAMVAMTPLITLQLMGLVYKLKIRAQDKAIREALDEEEFDANTG
ncbi:MAG TPA: DUF1538 domain-containing protein [Anaerolineaceae bacterium]|nr:DUF1538 domain-containing protein [Anaerolineaceae bacterium]